jgi:hypothetical protein
MHYVHFVSEDRSFRGVVTGLACGCGVIHQSHACEQVATGRLNPASSAASYDQNIGTGDSQRVSTRR